MSVVRATTIRMEDGGRVKSNAERPLVAVVDYGIGNLRSAEKALQHLGADAQLTANADEISPTAMVASSSDFIFMTAPSLCFAAAKTRYVVCAA